MTSRPRGARSLVYLALILVAAAARPQSSVFAQVTFRTMGEEIGDMFEDVGYLVRSPLNANRQDWLGVALTGVGFAAFLTVDEPVDTWVVRHPDEPMLRLLSPFRETGPLTRLVTARQLVPLSAVLVLAGAATDNRGLREAGFGCMSGWAVSNIVRYATYAVVARDRPYVADGNALAFRIPGAGWDQHSFFAGHATNAFTCTSFWNSRFDLSVAEPVLYAGAALVSLSRIADRRHWTSDTFLGVVVGIAIGQTLARRYATREAEREADAAAARNAGARRNAGALASNPAERAAHHSRLVAQRPIVILWRGQF